MSPLPIYMDHHATTPVDPRVMEAMLPYFSEKFGNAASVTHSFGWDAQDAVESARAEIAQAIGADPKEIIFTSGATESDNLAIKGTARTHGSRGRHLIVSEIEHNAALDCIKRQGAEGFSATYIQTGEVGIVDPEDVRKAITDQTILISVMAANNEIGTIQPVRAIGQIARERGIYFHTDAAQAVGRVPLNVEDDFVDMMSISAHKIYGPKGIGALYVRRRKPRVKLEPLIDGGGHELGIRSGTLPVPLIVGFARAISLAMEMMSGENVRIAALRDRLLHSITERLDDVQVNGSLTHRLSNNLNLSFGGVNAEAVLSAMKEIALSSGSACSAAEVTPSHVLTALGLSDDRAKASIRFGLGRGNTREEVDYVANRVVETVSAHRQLAPGRPPEKHQ